MNTHHDQVGLLFSSEGQNTFRREVKSDNTVRFAPVFRIDWNQSTQAFHFLIPYLLLMETGYHRDEMCERELRLIFFGD